MLRSEYNVMFFDILGVVYHEYLPVGQTINQYFYKDVLEHLREKVFCKELDQKLHKVVLHHSNVPRSELSVMQFFTQKQITALEHLSCSPNLASFDILCSHI